MFSGIDCSVGFSSFAIGREKEREGEGENVCEATKDAASSTEIQDIHHFILLSKIAKVDCHMPLGDC